MFRNMVIIYGEELFASRPIPKLEDDPLLAVGDCFNVFAATLHNWHSTVNLNNHFSITYNFIIREGGESSRKLKKKSYCE
jgi:hypothetical protein